MLHLCSKGCEYALQALTTLDRRECRDGFSVGSVCRKAGIPEPFTRKVFQILVKRGVLAAKRGPGGGYRLKASPSKTTILSIIHAVDGRGVFDKCVMKDRKCDETGHCALHEHWQRTKSGLIAQLQGSTVADFIIPEPRSKRD